MARRQARGQGRRARGRRRGRRRRRWRSTRKSGSSWRPPRGARSAQPRPCSRPTTTLTTTCQPCNPCCRHAHCSSLTSPRARIRETCRRVAVTAVYSALPSRTLLVTCLAACAHYGKLPPRLRDARRWPRILRVLAEGAAASLWRTPLFTHLASRAY